MPSELPRSKEALVFARGANASALPLFPAGGEIDWRIRSTGPQDYLSGGRSPDSLPSQNASAASPEVLFALRQLHDGRVLESDELATAGQGNWILETAGPGYLKASREPGPGASLCFAG
jgi:hypothetical protein